MSAQPYDPGARRDTPLAHILRARIAQNGPIGVRDYMVACLADPHHGYYRTQVAIGKAGDFVTAPEISQAFGELIGLWAAVVWQQMGCPARIDLVEVGGGRGSLMRDALRAMRVVPGLLAALDVHMVEMSPLLAEVQRAALSGTRLTWHPDIVAFSEHRRLGQASSRDPTPSTDQATSGRGQAALTQPAAFPLLLVANEFLDTGPVDQFVFAGGRWRERCVGVDDRGALQFAVRDTIEAPPLPFVAGAWQEGAIIERFAFGARDAESGLLQALGSAGRDPCAALFIDYGHTLTAPGDSLQAVRVHRFEHPLTSPGEADLSVQVDFAQFAGAARGLGFAVDGPVTQAEFLGRLGIVERASKLMAANPSQANAIEMAIMRLMAPQGMGGRFKAIGLRSPRLPPLPGFGE